MLEDFPLIWRFTVPFSDVDMMRHVNNVAYIRWAETMRAEYFAQVMRTPINGEQGMIQATINFTYDRELSYREPIAIGVKIPRIGTKSWDFYYEVWSESQNASAAHGVTTMVAYDFVNERTIAIPQTWRDAISEYERGPQRIYR
jgi:acyl-CoA thioester hydrolase